MIWIAFGYWIGVSVVLTAVIALSNWLRQQHDRKVRAQNVAEAMLFQEQLERWRDEQDLWWAREEARMLGEIAVLEQQFALPPSPFSPLWER